MQLTPTLPSQRSQALQPHCWWLLWLESAEPEVQKGRVHFYLWRNEALQFILKFSKSFNSVLEHVCQTLQAPTIALQCAQMSRDVAMPFDPFRPFKVFNRGCDHSLAIPCWQALEPVALLWLSLMTWWLAQTSCKHPNCIRLPKVAILPQKPSWGMRRLQVRLDWRTPTSRHKNLARFWWFLQQAVDRMCNNDKPIITYLTSPDLYNSYWFLTVYIDTLWFVDVEISWARHLQELVGPCRDTSLMVVFIFYTRPPLSLLCPSLVSALYPFPPYAFVFCCGFFPRALVLDLLVHSTSWHHVLCFAETTFSHQLQFSTTLETPFHFKSL